MITSMGLNETAAFDMSSSLVKLSADLASFYNISSDDALQKLKSGLMGEAEPMKALGVLVNDTTIKTWAFNKGLIKQGQEMSEQQKVIARYSVMMEATSKAQGDLARTLDSPTNRLRIMKSQVTDLAIELGNKLMPAFIKLLDVAKQTIIWLQGLADKFNALTSKQQDTLIAIVAITAALGPMALGVGTLITALSNLATSAGFAALIKAGPLIAIATAGVAAYSGIKSGSEITDPTKATANKFGIGRAWSANDVRATTPSVTQLGGYSTMGSITKQEQMLLAAKAKYNTAQEKLKSNSSGSDLLKLFNGSSITGGGAAKVDAFAESVKSMVDAIKEQTKSFANFVGLFDVFERKAVSGDRLLARLKAQIKAMGEWRTTMASLEKRGVSSELLNDLRGMGPSAVDSIKGLAGLSDAKLKEYTSLYGQKGTMGGEQAAKYVTANNAAQTKIEKQTNIYVTGSKGDADAVANAIVKKLRLAGYTI
jgi:hypothetical protein